VHSDHTQFISHRFTLNTVVAVVCHHDVNAVHDDVCCIEHLPHLDDALPHLDDDVYCSEHLPHMGSRALSCVKVATTYLLVQDVVDAFSFNYS